MKKIDQPAAKVEEIIDTCLRSLRKPAEQALLTSLKPYLLNKEEEYFSQGGQGTLHSLREALTNACQKAFLKKLYTDKLAHKDGCCRAFYDKIKVQAADTCPYCEVGRITTLDHFLPKCEHPTFSITPINLVPACSDCNHLKHDKCPTTSSDAFVHPYFEDTEQDIWLRANLNFERGIVYYTARPSPTFSMEMRKKISNTFYRLQLYSLYNIKGNSHLSYLKGFLESHFKLIPPIAILRGKLISQYLRSVYQAHCRIAMNSWETVLYRMLCSTPGYYNGGYRKFGGR